MSGPCGSQDLGLASDAVAQQPDGHVRFEFPLTRAQDVQGSSSEDAHDGGRVSGADAAVVLAELHVQGAVQPVLDAPVAAHEGQQGGGIHGSAGDVVAHGALPAAPGAGAFRLHADQAAQAGPGFGVRDPTRPGPCSGAARGGPRPEARRRPARRCRRPPSPPGAGSGGCA